MKSFLSILFASSLAACSGGGSAPGVTPPTAVPTLAPKTVSIAFTSLGITTQARSAKVPCANATSAPTVLQAEANWNPPVGTSWGALDGQVAQATEFDANCNAVNNSPVFAFSDTSLVSTTIPGWVGVLPSPPPGAQYIFGQAPGLETVTAKFADGTTGSAQAHVYGQMGVGCYGNFYLGQNGRLTPGWSDLVGQTIQVNACRGTVSSPVPADIQMDAGGNNLVIPGGYDIVESASSTNIIHETDLAGVANCSAFASQGTTVPLSNLPPGFLMLFKAQDGKCVKFFLQTTPSGGGIVGLFAVSDASGNFAY